MIASNLKCHHPDCGRIFQGHQGRIYCSTACHKGHRAILFAGKATRCTRRESHRESTGFRDFALRVYDLIELNIALDRWLEKRGLDRPRYDMRDIIRQAAQSGEKRRNRINAGEEPEGENAD